MALDWKPLEQTGPYSCGWYNILRGWYIDIPMGDLTITAMVYVRRRNGGTWCELGVNRKHQMLFVPAKGLWDGKKKIESFLRLFAEQLTTMLGA